MFYTIYTNYLTESITVSHLLEHTLSELREEGYAVEPYDKNENYYDDDEYLKGLVNRFVKRFQKLTGYSFE
jgi:hypothetical protein